MRLHGRWAKLALMLALLSLFATACRGSDDTADEGGDDTEAAAEDDAAADDEPTEDPAAADEPTDEPTAADEPTEDAGESAPGDVTFDVGVTEEACPDAVNPDNGCIYLGTLSDLTVGPFAALAGPITDAQAAFWNRVNEDGGIGGFDVDVATYVRDNQYSPEVHSQLYEEIKGEVLALAQTLGSPTTFAILEDMQANDVVAAPASWTSAWLFSDVILESGTTYCIESMNGLDYIANEEGTEIGTVMAVHYPGDYGDDGAAGGRIWAEQNDAEFVDVPTVTGQDNQGEAVSAIVNQSPDVVIITTGPAEAGTLVGLAAAQGFTGRFVFNGPAFNEGLLNSPAVDAVTNLVLVAGPWEPYHSDTPGHQAMRDALGIEEGNEGFTSGWAWSYPLLAVLEQAAANGDLTRAGVRQAISEITEVDYEGMLPEGAGNLSGEPNESALRASSIGVPTTEFASGLEGQGFYAGPTAEAFEFGDVPCYEAEG